MPLLQRKVVYIGFGCVDADDYEYSVLYPEKGTSNMLSSL